MFCLALLLVTKLGSKNMESPKLLKLHQGGQFFRFSYFFLFFPTKFSVFLLILSPFPTTSYKITTDSFPVSGDPEYKTRNIQGTIYSKAKIHTNIASDPFVASMRSKGRLPRFWLPKSWKAVKKDKETGCLYNRRCCVVFVGTWAASSDGCICSQKQGTIG